MRSTCGKAMFTSAWVLGTVPVYWPWHAPAKVKWGGYFGVERIITHWVLTASNIFISTVCYLPSNPAECEEVLSEPQGTDGLGKRYTFIINSPDEYVTAVDVRAGGWVDAIRLHTNYKSSVWMGGTGGEQYHLRPPPGRKILGIIGTSGKLVGSFGVVLSR